MLELLRWCPGLRHHPMDCDPTGLRCSLDTGAWKPSGWFYRAAICRELSPGLEETIRKAKRKWLFKKLQMKPLAEIRNAWQRETETQNVRAPCHVQAAVCWPAPRSKPPPEETKPSPVVFLFPSSKFSLYGWFQATDGLATSLPNS